MGSIPTVGSIMKIKDPIYGNFEIKEPVLTELINSPSLERLKKIEQYGLPKDLYLFPGFSRFEHCLGVMLIIRKLSGALEEQIAGLLHDVSHTAFSHIIDWVVGDSEKENFQDKNHKKFILSSEIPKILKKYDFDTNKIIKLKQYKLLERKTPELCADRVDYALREFYYWLDPNIVKICVRSLAVKKERIIFKNIKIARLFAINFLKLQSMHWGGKDTVIRYFLFSQILKIALNKKILKRKDFYSDDLGILDKLKSSKDLQIKKIFTLLSRSLNLRFNPKKPFMFMRKKFRYVDPMFLRNGKVYKLSKIDPSFKELLEVEQRINKEGVKINFPI